MPSQRRPEPLGHRAGGAGAEEGIEHEVARIGGGEQDAVQQRLRLLRRVRLAPLAVLQPLRPRADREQPVGAHLDVVVQRLHGLVVERDARLGIAAGPDQRLVRVGEALAAEVRHRVGLAPDDVVLDPEAQVLQRHAEAEDVVVGADHPDGAVGLQDAPALARARRARSGRSRRTRRTCPRRRRRRRPRCCWAAAARRSSCRL